MTVKIVCKTIILLFNYTNCNFKLLSLKRYDDITIVKEAGSISLKHNGEVVTRNTFYI